MRIILAMHVLINNRQLLFVRNLDETKAYKHPRVKLKTSPSFLGVEICKDQHIGTGRQRITMSKTVLRILVARYSWVVFRHLPPGILFQK